MATELRSLTSLLPVLEEEVLTLEERYWHFEKKHPNTWSKAGWGGGHFDDWNLRLRRWILDVDGVRKGMRLVKKAAGRYLRAAAGW